MALKMTQDLYVVSARYGHIEQGTEQEWLRADCPTCGGTQAVNIAYTKEGADPEVTWARCVNCKRGFVVNDGSVSPAPLPFGSLKGLDKDTAEAWREIRACLSVGATTATVHMCRKVLLHVAVEKGLPDKNGKGFAPSFAACIDFLKAEGLVTPPMDPWVQKIRNVGNDGAHELASTPMASAKLVAQFTEQLLRLIYEMPALMVDAED